MNLNKSRVAIVLSLIISCFLAICTALTQPVNAYFNKKFDDGSGNKNIQCFDVRFEKPEEYIDGTGVTVISSNLICAQVNKKGIATKIYLGDEHAKDATAGYPKFNIDENTGLKTTISIQRCDNNANNAGIGGELFACIRDGKTGKVITDSKTFTYDKKGEQTFEDFAKGMYDYINGLDNLYPISDFTDKTTTKSHAEIENEENGQKDSEPSCFKQASSLGWILCPVLDLTSDAVQFLYDNIVRPFLEIDAEILTSDTSNNTGLYNAWQFFQGFANIIFVILILAVILSQVTGVGISNYGIKKALPKIIIVAVLVNLSYIICQLAVDISNILGYSLENLFNRLADGLTVPENSGEFSDAINGVASTVITSLVAVLAIKAVGAIGLLLAFVPCIIAAFVAVLFFFIILGVRRAAIILLVALSPIAIVCYALPNTSQLFSKWRKTFVTLLLVFPICGILIGGGNFAAKLLLVVNGDNDDFFIGLVAMLVGVVPFFFVPSIVKGSMTAIGNLGTKISNLGGRLGGRVTGSVKGSEIYKGLQRNDLQRKNLRTYRSWLANSNTDIGRRIKDNARKAYNKMALEDAEVDANASGRLLEGEAYKAKVQEFADKAKLDRIHAQQSAVLSNINNGGFNILNDDGSYRKSNAGDKTSGALLFRSAREAAKESDRDQSEAVARASTNLGGNQKFIANGFNKSLSSLGRNANTAIDDHDFLQSDTAQDIFKQMTQGENSKNFRASSPLAFDYAGQSLGKDSVKTQDEYYSDIDNFNGMMDRHVTDGSVVYGMSNSALEDMNSYLGQHASKLDNDKLNRYATLFNDAQNYSERNGTYDNSKQQNVDAIKQLLNNEIKARRPAASDQNSSADY